MGNAIDGRVGRWIQEITGEKDMQAKQRRQVGWSVAPGRAVVRVRVRVLTQFRACDARKSERQKPAGSNTNKVSAQQEEGRQAR